MTEQPPLGHEQPIDSQNKAAIPPDDKDMGTAIEAARRLMQASSHDGSPTTAPDITAGPTDPQLASSTEFDLGQTMAERHPDWPPLRLHVFLSAHRQPKDIAGMAEPLKKADIYLYETMAGNDFDHMFQVFADADPTVLPKTHLDDEIDRLERDEGWRLRGTPQEGIIRALYGSKKIIGHIDLRESEVDLAKAIYLATRELPLDHTGSFDQCLEGIRKNAAEIAGLQNQREDIMLQRLETELENIFKARPELMDRRLETDPDTRRPVEILATLGSTHTTFFHKARKAGVDTERSFSHMPHIYTSALQAERVIAAGRQEPNRDLLAKAYMEDILYQALYSSEPTGEDWTSDDEDAYLLHCSEAFSTPEIEGVFELARADKLTVEDLEKILISKGLEPFPTNNDEMQKILHDRRQAKEARQAAIQADYERRKSAKLAGAPR